MATGNEPTPAPAPTDETQNINRIVRVTAWRETAPSDPTAFSPKKLNFSQVVIQDLEVKFKIEHTLRKNPNTCDITIFNCAPDTQAFLQQKPLVCQIAAGYNGVARLLFEGDVRFAMTELKSPNYETLLQLGDGDCNHRFSRVRRSYKGGTTIRQVITDCVTSFGYSIPSNLSRDPALDRQITGGTVSHGPAKDELTRLLAPLGYTWSIQNGVFQALGATEAVSGHAWPVDQHHGMIGTPNFGSPPRSGKPPHMKVRMELYPELTCGCLIDLTSKTKSGRFRVERVTHEGSSIGDGDFVTEIEIMPISAGAGSQAAAGVDPTKSNPLSSAAAGAAWAGSLLRPDPSK